MIIQIIFFLILRERNGAKYIKNKYATVIYHFIKPIIEWEKFNVIYFQIKKILKEFLIK